MDLVTGLILGMSVDSTLPEELKEFLSRDDQGIEGLDLMLKDSKLCQRIPSEVRVQYEILYSNLSSSIEEQLTKLQENIDEIMKNPKETIHQILQMMYVSSKAD